MNISLPPELERYVKQQVESGAYDSVGAVVRAALSRQQASEEAASGTTLGGSLGDLGNADEAKRKQAVENHHRWVEWAKFLGCHSIRVNAKSSGGYDEQIDRAADGLRRLTEFAAKEDVNVIVENHGGLSSNGAWLAAVMKKVGR